MFSSQMAWPKAASRTPLPPEVPSPYADDYREACLVLADSPKASAALSRRCLQAVLRDKAGLQHKDLAPAIDELIKSQKVPSHIAEAVDAIRQFGNFAAHPMKVQQTGEIVEVEPGEAEWSLEMLFDFYFVQPQRAAEKRALLNAKLQAAGKPPMK